MILIFCCRNGFLESELIFLLFRGRVEFLFGVWVILFERKILLVVFFCVLRGKVGKRGERRKICG